VREPGEPNDEIGANLVQALGKCRRLAIASDCFGLFGGTRGPCLSSAVAREKAVLAKIAVTNMQTILRTLSNRVERLPALKEVLKLSANARTEPHIRMLQDMLESLKVRIIR